MKIGIYDPYLDDLGGGEKYMMTLAGCLAKEHEVFLFWDNKEDIDQLEQRFAIDFSNIKLTKNIFSPQVGFFKRFFATKKYDAIIYLSDGSLPLVYGKKLYVHIQQPLHEINTNSLKDRLKLLTVNSFFCNSEYTKKFVSQKIHKKIQVLYPPVVINPQKEKKENWILHVGRFRTKNVAMDDYKKQFFMVKTFKKMVDNGLKDWKFIIAVSVLAKDQDDFIKLQKSAEGYPIKFYVNLTNEQLWELYNKAKIYWHASGFGEDLTKYPERAEHFGISTVEAMGAGAVPVVINAGGQKEIVTDGENGLLWNTQEELQEKTLSLVRSSQKIEKLSQEAQKTANMFSDKNFCHNVYTLIQ